MRPRRRGRWGVPASFAEHAALMYDLQLLAYQSDRTRVITFMIGHELSGRTYPEAGVFEAHHPLSHHKNIPETLAKLTKIQTYHMSLFASFLEKLRATPDGDGSLLDHVTIVYGAGFSDSNAHSPRNLPILLAGGGGGQLKGGQHLVYPDGAPLANLHVALLGQVRHAGRAGEQQHGRAAADLCRAKARAPGRGLTRTRTRPRSPYRGSGDRWSNA